jgi:hypothetical protein
LIIGYFFRTKFELTMCGHYIYPHLHSRAPHLAEPVNRNGCTKPPYRVLGFIAKCHYDSSWSDISSRFDLPVTKLRLCFDHANVIIRQGGELLVAIRTEQAIWKQCVGVSRRRFGCIPNIIVIGITRFKTAGLRTPRMKYQACSIP